MSKLVVSLLGLAAALPILAQEADSGFTMPITLSVDGMYSHRWQSKSPDAGPLEAGARLMLYPSVKLGGGWFAYSALQVHSSPYFNFEANSANNKVYLDLIQAFVGYTRGSERKSITLKAGHLNTAFGSFPLLYDDTRNALLGAPLSYGSAAYGSFPVTLYGLPGAEVDASYRRLDGRLQFTNSSPANPKTLFAPGQHPNWAMGGGFTIKQGLRVGASMYHGPYLQLGRFLAPGENPSDWPFSAAGVDAQWRRGRWSVSGEWQRFYYFYPRYIQSPDLHFGYIEAKSVISPRLYLATRVGYNTYSSIQTISMAQPTAMRPNRDDVELAVGYRVNRHQLLKVGYEWLYNGGTLNLRSNILGAQFVTSIDAISKAFH